MCQFVCHVVDVQLPQLIAAILNNPLDSTRRTAAHFRSLPEAILRSALQRINTLSIFYRNWSKRHRSSQAESQTQEFYGESSQFSKKEINETMCSLSIVFHFACNRQKRNRSMHQCKKHKIWNKHNQQNQAGTMLCFISLRLMYEAMRRVEQNHVRHRTLAADEQIKYK